jgi:molybdopterin synthase catalytic subunit
LKNQEYQRQIAKQTSEEAERSKFGAQVESAGDLHNEQGDTNMQSMGYEEWEPTYGEEAESEGFDQE